MSTAPAKSASGASQLQRKIFTRWVNQKLGSRKMKVEDCVTGLGTGLELVAMLEVLSEKTCPKQLKKLDAKSPPIQKVDNLQHALKFMYDCGVVLELKPSAENFVDGEEKSILGAVWGIMKTFLKFGDDDENKMNAVDALKMWAVNQTHGYKGVNIQDFTKSWHDGLAFCALIHKHRPKLIGDFDKLNPKEDEKNIKIAMAAAEKFFQLEQFLQPGDIKKLDDKSMVIYVSEFYYGIAAQRKVDLAARRIGKLIQFTQINDKMRAEYQSRAESMKKGLDKVMVHLRDRTIDNTMAGAKKRLDQFVEYREKDKAGIVGDFLSIESLFNQLSLRLSDRKRPLFVPKEGLDLPGLRAALAELEKCEAERKVALVAELNRQIKLANYSDQHATRCGAIASWGKEKSVFVGKVETIESVGAAEYHLNALAAFGNESDALQKGSAQEIRKLGKELLDEKYEHGADVQKREQEVDALFKQLNEQSAAKKQVLDDALAREKYKVLVRGWAQQHVDKHKKLAGWQQDKKEYLESEEKINSIDDAEQALSLLRGYQAESASLLPAAVPALRAVGKKVCDAKYETKFSKWEFENPQEIHDRESGIDATTQVLAALDAKKLKKLQDDLAREQFKAKLRMTNEQHIDRHKKLQAWVEDAKAYLGTEEKVNSIPTANEALNQLKQWEADKVVQSDTNVNPMKALGQEVLTKKYKTDLSAWQWETPDEIHTRESWVDEQWKVLSDLSKKKLAKLEDDLAREQFKEKLRLLNAQHGSGADKINDWVGESVTYLETKETLLSVAAAEVALNKLEGFESDKVIMTKTTVANLKKLGNDIVTLEYKTALSQWKWETPDQVKDRETKIDDQWKTLSELSVTKKARLDDDLAREKYKALVRTWNGNHVNTHKQISEWVDESVAYLKKAETITNIPTAQAALSALETFESDKVDVTNINIKSLKGYGQQVLNAEYKGLTQWKWETPNEINQREAWVEEQWAVLSKLSADKKVVLQKALELELEKERLRLVYANQAGDYVLWAKETSDDSAQTHFGFTLDEVQKFDLKGADKKVQDASAAKTERWKATYADLTKHEVKDNVYTKLTPSDLEKAAGDLGKALEARGGRYNAELKRQLDNDALCKEFAGLAEPLVKEIDSDKDKIAKSTADLDQQLAYVEERIKAAAGSDRLGKINALQEKMDKAGIKNNPHSAQNARDCEVLWKQYQAFLGSKKTSLGEQIEQKKLRGVTPDQFAEIKQQFTQFDKDASGAIDNRELRACLYSLGYEMGKEAVKSIMTDFGKDDAKHQGQRVMDFNGFKEFMIKQLGDSETKEELLAGFDMVSRSAPAGNNEQADTVLKDEDVQYLRANAPKAGNGQADYKAWILAALAR